MRKENVSARSALKVSSAIGLAVGLGAMALAPQAAAQAVSAVDDEIVVTGLKHGERNVQDVPVAVTAFGAEQLEALNFSSLQSLSYTIPNVQLEDIGTSPGVANFAIRGVGINSSIPSIDPTVGVFVDGMYMGINAGILTDSFDLAGVEVLRGPQGVLFGRNVTGGAIVLRTKAPSDELEINARAGVETGLNYTADFAISGPLAPGLLSGKLAVYYNDDEGWFENDFDGSQFGASRTNIYRGALRLTPTPDLEFILRVESGNTEGDGPAAQNHGLYSRDSFDFAINNRGFATSDWEQGILEMNWDVPFGDGTITNILGYRDYTGLSGGDIDATVNTAFHSRAVNLQNQWSNELRYAGTFGPLDLTLGHYMFEQELFYIEERVLIGAPAPRVGGGDGNFSTWAIFANTDWHVGPQVTINLGIRYSEEEKRAQVSRIRGFFDNLDGANVVPGEGVVGGSIDGRTLAFSDTPFDLKWHDISPRVGVQWQPNEDTNLYAFAAQGFRSGGVNFRVTTFGTTAFPQPGTAFDSEEQTSYEVGLKQDFFDGRGRLNLAIFHNQIDGMQRETNVPGASGVQQVIVNAGDAIIQGAEFEARFNVLETLMLQFNVGYTDAEYDSVVADLDGLQIDCVTPSVIGMTPAQTVGPCDLALSLPRVPEWTYGGSILWDLPLGDFGVLSSRVSYNHRDENFYTDNNRGRLNEADIVDFNLALRPNGGSWTFAVYGLNMLDETTFGGDTQLPDIAPFGGDGAGPNPPPTFSPLNKGRVLGAEVRVSF
jgi:iron complex outermembrane recepter protein